jgi:hypothetical protein
MGTCHLRRAEGTARLPGTMSHYWTGLSAAGLYLHPRATIPFRPRMQLAARLWPGWRGYAGS